MKALLWRLLGKHHQAVVLHFATGAPDRVRAMYEEIRALEPAREHLVACWREPIAGLPCLTVDSLADLRRQLGPRRIGLAPFLLNKDHPLFPIALRAAPRRLLAFNHLGQRHHLSLSSPITSLLFWRGRTIDEAQSRPAWWPVADRRSKPSTQSITLTGRPLTGRPRVAVVSPYFPWPLGHGGVVRIFHMLREAAKEFDLFLYCFAEPGAAQTPGPLLELIHQAVLFELPEYREPRWSSLLPPEVREFHSPALHARLAADNAQYNFLLVQAEYTQLAPYTADILVEHDVTFDLYRQLYESRRGLVNWWNWYRWHRFETRAARRVRAVVVMADKDAQTLAIPHTTILPNGVDLARFQPTPEPPSPRLLFIGSFRHFPNITAFRFFYEEVWPAVRAAVPGVHLEVVAGPDHLRYWPQSPASSDSLTLHGFVADVVPLYHRATLVLAPTLVSAGTNLKVLEAMAMERAVVATPSGCAGLGLTHGESVWIAADAAAFAAGVIELLNDPARRIALSRAARRIAEAEFDWPAIGRRQAELWRSL